MARKRKRSQPGQGHEDGGKRQRISSAFTANGRDPIVKNALLALYYPRVVSLREYLVSKLPSTSKIRRKKILSFGRKPEWQNDQRDQALAAILDQALIGVLKDDNVSREERLQQWTSFSQYADTSASILANLSGAGIFSQSEIVDFTIWLSFSKASTGRSSHLLCQGFQKDVSFRSVHHGENATSAIPGVISRYPNSHVTSIKAPPWPQVLALMGNEGERAMIDLILDCAIFLPIDGSRGSYHQLSGQPLSELKPLQEESETPHSHIASRGVTSSVEKGATNTASSIVLVRNRMLYARAALNAQGGVRFGLRHIHVLNRYPSHMTDDHEAPDEDDSTSALKPSQSTIHVMMYMFPRQFGLHNVFTSAVDHRETVQPLKDYTLREDEISQKYPSPPNVKIPKRLRGNAVALVHKLQIRHSRCPYKKLLEYYCPALNQSRDFRILNTELETNNSVSTAFESQLNVNTSSAVMLSGSVQAPPRKPSFIDHASSTAQVSAFCRAVLSHLIPSQFWGSGEARVHNEKIFHRNVDRFIDLRRFESLSLREVSHGIKVAELEWLRPPKSSTQKLSLSDFNKRIEIAYEFIYYVFDSILIPLIRTNFYVTESNFHRYRIFYFRQDVWRSLSEPAMASIKINMFEEIKMEQAQNILNSRMLGFSQVRLLPKEAGVRPIMNLRRRTLTKGKHGMLGSSINSTLAPVYNVLKLERALNPDQLGSALFSVGDLYAKLKSFKSKAGGSPKPFYFAKVDVKAAFDTIPQNAVIRFMSSIPSESEYRIAKHVEIKPGEGYHEGIKRSKPIRKWTALAKTPDDFQSFNTDLETNLGAGRKNTVFVENVVNQFCEKEELLHLLAEHIQRNMVKIGKKYYRQKEGIPQGSVLSSLLCNYFYADLEMQHLDFLQYGEESLLLRLIDDFLLITTNPAHAKKFLQVMHDGVPAYGICVNPDKTLVNFEATINEKKVPRLIGGRSFPYCGSFIDTKNLNISKDRERRKNLATVDSLTVEYSKVPGKTFHRKVLNTFKIQSHPMFFDTTHNSQTTVLTNIYTAFIETATKMWSYARCLPSKKQPNKKLVIQTIQDVINLAFMLLKSKSRKKTNDGFKCAVSKSQVEWLATCAFRQVLGRRQTNYEAVIEWLDMRSAWIDERNPKIVGQLRRLTKGDVLRDGTENPKTVWHISR